MKKISLQFTNPKNIKIRTKEKLRKSRADIRNTMEIVELLHTSNKPPPVTSNERNERVPSSLIKTSQSFNSIQSLVLTKVIKE